MSDNHGASVQGFNPSRLRKPYWRSPELPCLDFNREIILPGKLDAFPDGVVGVRVDDDFWAVAALPYADFKDVPIEQIVALLWPQIVDQAEYNPDARDSDGSGEADKTGTGLAEGDSAVPQECAQTPPVLSHD